MSSLSDASLQVIHTLESDARKQFPEQEVASFIAWIHFYFSKMPAMDLVSRSGTDLYGAALTHWQLMQTRMPGELKLHVFNPQYETFGWQSTHTIIQIVMDNMPFLVDTVRIELDRMGLETQLMIHCGGLRVLRDETGRLQEMTPHHEQSHYLDEAPMQFEISCQTDPNTLAEIKSNIVRVLNDVRAITHDKCKMHQEMKQCISNLEVFSKEQEEVQESCAFLEWVLQHFIFFGYRAYQLIDDHGPALQLMKGCSLGVLKDETHGKSVLYFSDLSESFQKTESSDQKILIISKTKTLSSIHRADYTDIICVRQFDSNQQFIGEKRFIGLYASEVYYQVDPCAIPLVRYKIYSILSMFDFPDESYAKRDLLHILTTLPRDELFHASTKELFKLTYDIFQMQNRSETRMFIRRDVYGRFLSCLVYLKKDNLTTAHVEQIAQFLAKTFDAAHVSHTLFVSESILGRIHYIVRVKDSKKNHDYQSEELEKHIACIVQSWEDGLCDELIAYCGEERGHELIRKYKAAFPAGYRDAFSFKSAVCDIKHLESLDGQHTLGISFYRPLQANADAIHLKLYQKDAVISLSDTLPILENLGLRVLDEQSYVITCTKERSTWISDFRMTFDAQIGEHVEIERIKDIFQDAFQAVWHGYAENDALNRLVLSCQARWHEVQILRAYSRYAHQIGMVFSESYVNKILNAHHTITTLLIQYFQFRFDPDLTRDASQKAQVDIAERIESALESITNLNEDLTLRRYLMLISSTCRTNYFQTDENGQRPIYLALKMDPSSIPGVPAPIPKHEIFVYARHFEGIHLRACDIARGGIRWSDRLEDYRTEALGLMKAQQVKNAFIVPGGAKGCFVVKVSSSEREKTAQLGLSSYQDFIRGLLSVIDNWVDHRVLQPKRTVCYDARDFYLPVAADKGTATFSDFANAISLQQQYWLGDAFASGGSTGYDHKQIAITSRGMWSAATYHFQCMGIDINQEEITIAGIGDMSGDIFGNGLLMSPRLKLLAAFNHMHIFLDPNPDLGISFGERKRLFALPRSTWQDYNTQLISQGGGVYSRASKSISISPEVQSVLGIESTSLEPQALIRAILQMPVDILLSGGVGTYVKSSNETQDEVNDHTNDSVRINGNQLRAKFLAEGGNLGITQWGRIEYELNGGCCDKDSIHNASGVNCSDHEVNIKILLNRMVASGDLTLQHRNQLLSDVTEEVASMVLQEVSDQIRIIDFSFYYGHKLLPLLLRLTRSLEKDHQLNRSLECIAEDEVILNRQAPFRKFLRSELSILISYSKLATKADLLNTPIMDDPYIAQMVEHGFPMKLREKYSQAMLSHNLAKEIVATQLTNQMVTEMGITFAFQMQTELNAPIDWVVKAYTAARIIFKIEGYGQAISALDKSLSVDLRYKMMNEGMRAVRRAVRWLLRNHPGHCSVVDYINHFAPFMHSIAERLPKLLLGVTKIRFDADALFYREQNVPEALSIRTACLAQLHHAFNIIEAVHKTSGEDILRVAKIYFTVFERLDLPWFREQITNFPTSTHWSIMAKSVCKTDLDRAQCALTVGVLSEKTHHLNDKINAWFKRHQYPIAAWKKILEEIRLAEHIDFEVLFVALQSLIKLSQSKADAAC